MLFASDMRSVPCHRLCLLLSSYQQTIFINFMWEVAIAVFVIFMDRDFYLALYIV